MESRNSPSITTVTKARSRFLNRYLVAEDGSASLGSPLRHWTRPRIIFFSQQSPDQGEVLDEEVARRLFSLPASLEACSVFPEFRREIECRLQSRAEQRQTEIRRAISDRNARFFEAEAEKLDSWADDQKLSLEREIKEMDRQIKEARRSATASVSLEEKLAGQKEIKALEAQRNHMRRSLFDAQDRIDLQREKLIAQIESKLTQQTRIVKLFLIRWCLQ